MKALKINPNDISGNATVSWDDVDTMKPKTSFVNGGESSSSSMVTPAGIAGEFDDTYQKATAGYTPFVGDHSKIDQLQNLYGTVGDAFDVSGTVAALDKSRRTNLLTGEAAANDAASKFQETQGPGTQSGTAASLIRARSLLPFLQADTSAAAETGKYVDTAKQNALKTGADIASSLAQLEQQYTNSLASYNSERANFGLDYTRGKTGTEISANSTTNDGLRLGLLAQQQANENNRTMQNSQDAERQRQLALIMARRQQSSTSTSPASGMSFVNNVGQSVRI